MEVSVENACLGIDEARADNGVAIRGFGARYKDELLRFRKPSEAVAIDGTTRDDVERATIGTVEKKESKLLAL